MEPFFFLHSLALTTLLLLLLHTTFPPSAAATTAVGFVEKSCAAAARYPDLCIATLSPHALTIHASPKLLASTALSVALTAARSTLKSISETTTYTSPLMKRTTPLRMSPREAAAWRDCKGLVGDSVGQLERSVGEMGEGDDGEGKMMTRFQVSNVQTWASAAMTDLDTCTDGFEDMDGVVKRKVMGSGVVDVGHMISNALAFVNQYGEGIN